MNDKEIKEFVKKRYGEIAKGTCECCAPSSSDTLRLAELTLAGYSVEDLEGLPASVLNASGGCGNPTALADLREGETVLDLGSGAGIDAFLAAKKVGPKGRVIGVDMTKEMVRLANQNAKEIGATNVEFKLGEIENLPIENSSIDVIISNCVVCLSPYKDKVFHEAYRVLRPGGRMIISDIVTKGELPKEMSKDLESWADCAAGALKQEEYIEKIKQAGFKHVKIISEKKLTILKREENTFVQVPHELYSTLIKAIKPF